MATTNTINPTRYLAYTDDSLMGQIRTLRGLLDDHRQCAKPAKCGCAYIDWTIELHQLETQLLRETR